ncbi:MAB_1171c family putative transporter [Micromonospora profundi]|uniref:MAB_1171c family putative transporter n=1 Tax=Micromonospora profundi TaxID=1420889 RepID=UPI003668EE6C
MLVTAGHITGVVIAAVALFVKLGALRRDPSNPRTRASVAICVGCGIAVTAGWAPVHSFIDTTSGVPNLAKLVEHGSALATATAIQFLFLHLGGPKRATQLIRQRLVLLAVVFSVMVTMFWLADFPESEPLHFAERYGNLWQVSVYMIAFLTYMAVSVVDILRMSHGYAKYARARLRTIMHLLSGGALFGAGFVVHKALFIGLKQAGVSPPWSEPIATQALITMSVALLCSSLVLATLWKTIDGVRAWPRRSTMFRDLHPLWVLLYQAVPDIALHKPRRPHRDPWWVWGAGQRLYRRCVEIGDGLRAIGPLDEDVSSAAQRRAADMGCDSARAGAAGAAAAILVAVRRLEIAPTSPQEIDPGLEPQPAKIAHADVEADARRLVLISMALSTKVVTDTVAEFCQPDATRP